MKWHRPAMVMHGAAVLVGWILMTGIVYTSLRARSRCPDCRVPWAQVLVGSAPTPNGDDVATAVCTKCGHHEVTGERCYPSQLAATSVSAVLGLTVVASAVAAWCVRQCDG